MILGFFKDDRATGRIIGNALPVMVIAVVLIWYFWKKRRPKWNREQVTYAVTYSLPLIPHGISQVILSQFDRIMIKSVMIRSEVQRQESTVLGTIFFQSSMSRQIRWTMSGDRGFTSRCSRKSMRRSEDRAANTHLECYCFL